MGRVMTAHQTIFSLEITQLIPLDNVELLCRVECLCKKVALHTINTVPSQAPLLQKSSY